MTVVFLGTLCLTLQCMIFSLIAERYPEAWKLRSGIEIAAVVCMAIVGNVVTAYVDTWCLRKRDPIYVAMFRPLGIAIVVVMTVIFLGTLFTLEGTFTLLFKSMDPARNYGRELNWVKQPLGTGMEKRIDL
ncbi:WAT1-related protein At4g15540-like isoform X1 [Punica granatum]|uniref:WAT1-related protein At4g15540-like isoform X1 n=1 Tax=Punica granatum TaxID=22663 RepID=A0A6P8CGU2_PUNGR|nr:WAT1-related protein At4g15540-like isoform X1 [Punica granatum]